MTDSTSVLSEFTPAAVDGVPTEVQVAQAGRTIEVTEPNAAWTVIHQLTPGETLHLDFDPAGVAKAEIKDGNLELTFDNGGVVLIQGYDAWAAAGGQATGPLGGIVDMAQLGQEGVAGGADAAADLAGVCTTPGGNVVDVPVPSPGEYLTLAVQPGDAMRLACSFSDVSGTEVGDTLQMTFPGGGMVVVENFSEWIATQGATVTDCNCAGINPADFVVALGLNPEDVLPAAGEGVQGGPQPPDHSGAAFTPGPGPQMLSGYPYPNILPPTGLDYGVPEPEESFFPADDNGGGQNGPLNDVPRATPDVVAAVTNTVNLVLVFDRSGSMDEDPNAPGFTTRIDLARAAVASMLAAYESVANVNILVVDFADNAANSGWLSGAAAANAYLAGLDAQGETNYNGAVQEVIASYSSGLPDAGQALVYFLSDGKPLPAGTSLAASGTLADWENFLVAQGIDRAFAVGMGPDVDDSDGDLSDIAFPNSGGNVLIVSNESDTFDALVSTVVEAGGNVVSDPVPDEFGADGPGSPAIVSIEVDGDLYEFDGTQITKNGAFFSLGSTLVVLTALGGELTFDFGNGDYTYDAPGPAAGGVEVFTYTIADSNGDTSSATLTVNLDELQVAQPNRVFGTDGNDGALIGSAGIDIIGGGDGNDSIDAGDGDDHISGGSGADTINGGSGNDVIVGGNQGEVTDSPGVVRPGGADLGDLIDGGDGDDVIYGNEGNDILLGGAGNDTIHGGSGHDTITGGEGDDVINLAQGGGNDVVRYTSVLDGHDIVNGFSSGAVGPDVFDLDGLFDSLGVATSDRAARVQIVDNGPTVDVNIDVDGSGTFGLTAATLVTPNPVTVGTDPGNHVQLGTL
jgi:Ca2+-binding RTX toxin-like protein